MSKKEEADARALAKRLAEHDEIIAACPMNGQGGSYEIVDGKRVLVERTGLSADEVKAHNAKAEEKRPAGKKE